MFFLNIRHKQLYEKIKLLPKTIKDYTVTEKKKMIIFYD